MFSCSDDSNPRSTVWAKFSKTSQENEDHGARSWKGGREGWCKLGKGSVRLRSECTIGRSGSRLSPGSERGRRGGGEEMRIRKQELTRGTRGHASPENWDFNSSEMRGKAFEIIKPVMRNCKPSELKERCFYFIESDKHSPMFTFTRLKSPLMQMVLTAVLIFKLVRNPTATAFISGELIQCIIHNGNKLKKQYNSKVKN